MNVSNCASQPQDLLSDVALTAEHPRVIEQIQEYRLALVRGERPPRDALLSRYPAIAGELADCLDALEFMHQVAPQLGDAVLDGLRASSVTPPALGDFRIVRELGRGGMGVVYEAEQISLNRRVALKVLPFAAVLDARQLQRFKNEAQAAASLHHTHIVPVYSVGCERGVHYYAMQYIEGETLAEVIRQKKGSGFREGSGFRVQGSAEVILKQQDLKSTIVAFSTAPERQSEDYFRRAAQLAMEVAEALDYAHQQGIVHRDIKPLNLMIDVQGKPWITDFGLAQIESNTQLTLTGDMLGTLRYMSPEQVSLKRAAIDHRTDIYSLGATMYELLTLEPAFTGATRQELLRQIAVDEPRPLRRLNSAIPVELETITLKAMAKDPAARYASGQDLADDLRRYLLDKPILARRPTLLDRTAKWARRHRAAVNVAAACFLLMLLLAIAALAASNALISRERDRTRQALEAAKAGQAEAAQARTQANANLRTALAAIDQMLKRLADQHPETAPETDPVRRQMLRDALDFYKDFMQQTTDDPQLRREQARTYRRIANIHGRLGNLDSSEVVLRHGLEEFQRLSDRHALADDLVAVAQLNTDLGVMLRDIPGREQDAEEAHRRSVEARQRLAAQFPRGGYEAFLAQGYHDLGYFLGQRRQFAEAIEWIERALNFLGPLRAQSPNNEPLREEEANYLNSLGLTLRQAGRPREAEDAHRRALALLETPSLQTLAHRNQLARTLGHLALAVEQSGRRAEAAPLLHRAIEWRRQLLAQWPHGTQERAELALTLSSLAGLLGRDRRPAEAETLFDEAIALQNTLVEDFPTVPKYRRDLGLILERGGRMLLADNRPADAQPLLRRALVLREQLLSQSPRVQEYQRDLAGSQTLSAIAGWRLDERSEAQTLYDQAAAWLDANKTDDAELRALRDEARALMHQ